MFSKFNQTRILAVALFIFSPLSQLEIADILSSDGTVAQEPGIMLPLLLILAAFSPFTLIVIEKGMIFAAKENKGGFDSPEDAWLKLFIVRGAVTQAIFVYGLVILFHTQYDFQRMLYFYPIGAVWAFFFWPTRKRYENFISQFEQR